MPETIDIEIRWDNKAKVWTTSWKGMVEGVGRSKKEALENLRPNAHLLVDTLIDERWKEVSGGL